MVLSVPFKYEASEDVRKLLEDFRDMINFCIAKALKLGITSFARLRKAIYEEFKVRWPDYATHYCHSACRVACSILRSWRKRGREPRAKKLFMRLDPELFKFMGDTIRITVRRGKWILLRLVVGSYQAKFVEAWRKGEVKVGEIVVDEEYAIVPFRKRVDLTNPSDWIALDINETNITGTATDGGTFRIDLSEVKRIHHAYFEIRRRIQAKFHDKPRLMRKLLAKYSKREQNRIRDLLHKAAKQVVDIAGDRGIVMENLNGIRKRIRYGRKMNRRLHSWPFRRLQLYIDYKAKLAGLPVHYVNPKGTSSMCPECGGKMRALKGRMLRCPRCGYEADRDVVASINILRRFLTQDVGSPVPPESPHTRGKSRSGMKVLNVRAGQNGVLREAICADRISCSLYDV